MSVEGSGKRVARDRERERKREGENGEEMGET